MGAIKVINIYTFFLKKEKKPSIIKYNKSNIHTFYIFVKLFLRNFILNI